jgi:hypothetical protein
MKEKDYSEVWGGRRWGGGGRAYNALVTPILLYGSEVWTLRQKDKKRLTPIEMKFWKS